MERDNENTIKKSQKGFFANLSDKFWENIRNNGFFWHMFHGIISSIIAALIAGLTFGLGTVSIASSIFLGYFAGRAIEAFVCAGKSKLIHINNSKDAKKSFIFTFLIASVFTLTTVLIGTLTFGFGLIPLGIFAATSLTTALGAIAFFSLNQSLWDYSHYKMELRYEAQEKLSKSSQVSEPLIDKNEKENENGLKTDEPEKPPNLEGEQKGNDDPNLSDS